ncbi:MAG: RidA family protein [Holophagales bacterium]|nr:RidA family protein [Holophagales bacterium]
MSGDDQGRSGDTGKSSAFELLPVELEGWKPPRGYANGTLAPAGGRLLFVAGQIAWDAEQRLVPGGFAEQFGRALANVVEVVRAAATAAGVEPDDAPGYVASLTIFVTSKAAYLQASKTIGKQYRRIMGRHYPAMALVEVKALLETGAMVEIQGQAVLPPAPDA